MDRWLRYAFVAVAAMCAVAACDRETPGEVSDTTQAATTRATESSEIAGDADAAPVQAATGLCVQAYDDLVALVKGLEEQLGSSDDTELPKREEFLKSCDSLPREVQQCMVFEYAMEHKETCEKRIDALDPTQKKTARELMGE